MAPIVALSQNVPLRGRPPANTPLDQRVTVTVTPEERARASFDMRGIGGNQVSISEVVRSRATATVDLVSWGDAARDGLVALLSTSNRRSQLRLDINSATRMVRQARVTGDTQGEELTLAHKAELEREFKSLKPTPPRRSSRLIGRLTSSDRETVAWRAAHLGLTISDYVRLTMFDYLPGDQDGHMSEKARENFYRKVIAISEEGSFPQQPSGDVCPNCRVQLPPRLPRN